MSESLTKKEAARRQLVTAIRLLFDEEDLVSIYSLAANAWEIVDTLASRAGIDSMSNQARENIPERKNLKRDYVNSPYRNFFKHANRDPDAVVPPLKEKNVDAIIFLSVEDYLRLYGKGPVEFQVFQLWYLALNIDKVASDALNRVMPTISAAFHNIRYKSRKEQLLMAHAALQAALIDRDILQDPRTET